MVPYCAVLTHWSLDCRGAGDGALAAATIPDSASIAESDSQPEGWGDREPQVRRWPPYSTSIGYVAVHGVVLTAHGVGLVDCVVFHVCCLAPCIVSQWVPLEQYQEVVHRCDELAAHGQSLIASLRTTRADLDAAQASVVQHAAANNALLAVRHGPVSV